MLFLGNRAAECSGEVLELVEKLDALTFACPLGQGILPGDHPLFLPWGWAEGRPARSVLEEADALLVIGADLSEVDTGQWTIPLPKCLIEIDSCRTVISKSYPVEVSLVGDPKAVLRQLLDRLSNVSRSTEASRTEGLPQIRHEVLSAIRDQPMWNFVDAMAQVLPATAFVTNDASISNGWVLAHLPRFFPRTMSITRSMAALGFAYPAALGARIAHPNRQAIAVVGDGGFLFSSSALATAVQYRLNAVAVIFNDNCYGGVKHRQTALFGRTIGVDLVNPDFVRLAEAYGAVGVRVSKPRQLRDALETAWQRELPTIIDVPIALPSRLLSPWQC
jgi:acetolactate synthase-1/2/3 large subunit